MQQTFARKIADPESAVKAPGARRFASPADSTADSGPHGIAPRTFPPSSIIWICALVAAGSLALLPVWSEAWTLWSSDPLRSIGAFFPLLSLLGVMGAWRRLGWRTDGNPWGFALMLLAVASASLFSAKFLLLFFFGQRMRLLHPGMALFAYGAGAALLFGGMPLLRKALAPLCLLLLIDPVPHWFNKLLDLPLQMLSANTARAFAHLIGLQPTGVQLQMMFTPTFGMFIVPGCNGVRGAITFGYLALIFGYVRHLPARVLMVGTACAVLVGYLFNLLRLCVLVLYYRAGMSLPAIRPYGTQADYAIGVTLFLTAMLGLGFAISSYAHRHGLGRNGLGGHGLGGHDLDRHDLDRAAGEIAQPLPAGRRPVGRRALALTVMALVFFLPQARSMAGSFRKPLTAADALRAYPATVGAYRLTHTWEERDGQGALMFVFGDYQRAGTGEHLAFGVYLASEDHYVFLSKLTQGVKPESQSSVDAVTATGKPAHLITSVYREDGVLTLDAEGSCREGLCEGNVAGDGKRVGMMRPHLADLLVAPATRRVPILLRRRWSVATPLPESVLEQQFDASVREFLSGLNLQPLLARAD